jgi:hypothetical protein
MIRTESAQLANHILSAATRDIGVYVAVRSNLQRRKYATRPISPAQMERPVRISPERAERHSAIDGADLRARRSLASKVHALPPEILVASPRPQSA